jgi:uncharacterized phage protein gp47/JayE
MRGLQMSYKIPTLTELFNDHLARLEAELNQDSPLNDKAFLQILAMVEAGLDIGLYKFSANQVLQNLALTATGDGLDKIGNDNDTPRKQEQAAILEAELPAVNGTVIPSTTIFTGDSNGLRYKPETNVTAAGGVAVLDLRCTDTGTIGNLDNGETLSISTQIAGAETVATVTDTVQLGVDEETDADYRPRVLFAQRAITGGANATDHKIWTEAVEGVRRGFPYSGRPASEGTSFPGDRTVYVEANTSIDPDGIAPQSLLDDVRDEINIDPNTGKSRAPLGLTDETLFVESITRTTFYLILTEFEVSAENEVACKAAIDSASTTYFLSIKPFLFGIDVAQEKNNIVTELTVADIVQDVLKSYGASATSIAFGLAAGVPETDPYTLDDDELGKYGSTSYV